MIEVDAELTVYDGEHLGNKRWYSRTFKLAGVPRVGDTIELTDGGWSEEIRTVWWLFDGRVMIDFPMHVTDSACEEIKRSRILHYASEDDLAALEPAGWIRR